MTSGLPEAQCHLLTLVQMKSFPVIQPILPSFHLDIVSDKFGRKRKAHLSLSVYGKQVKIITIPNENLTYILKHCKDL